MEIERKYLVETPPAGYESWPSSPIEQGYLCTDPVVGCGRTGRTTISPTKEKG